MKVIIPPSTSQIFLKKNFISLIKLCVSLIMLFSFALAANLSGQEVPRKLLAKYVTEKINIDGVMDEPVWQLAEKGHDFWQFFPTDTAVSINSTEFSILYDDQYLYIGIRAEAKSDKYVVRSLRRDFSGAANDNVSLMFDTFKDGSTAFLFGMTPYGVQREAFISGGGSDENGFNTSWDQKWVAESTRFDDHYVLEAAIPFSSIKFREGDTSWRMQCYRWDFQTNEQSAWARVPQNQMLSSLAFMGELEFEKPLGKSHTPFAIIPYIIGLVSKDFVTDQSVQKITFGADAKVALGNSMNLDLTLNPDFSNVEVDDIFTNLTRFEMYLPEKRQFFIDNNDLFGNYGDRYNAAKPFFSRRVGLSRNQEGNLIENRIIGGMRLSGKLNKDWRLGVLNIQTAADTTNHIASNNNMMITVQRKMFSRSSIGFFAINRESFTDYAFQNVSGKYNRVIGAEYNMASADNSWTGKFYLHKSFQPNDHKGNLSSQATVTYMHRNFQWIADLMYVDKDFKADLGFVPRTDILKNGNGFRWNFYPKNGAISLHGLGAMALYYWKPESNYRKIDHTYQLYYNINFVDQSILHFDFYNYYTFLTRDFDPTYSGGVRLLENTNYQYNQIGFSYTSNPAKVFSTTIQSSGGQFYNGRVFTAASEVFSRIQPYAQLSLNVRYDAIDLPKPYSSAKYWLITPRVDITFTKNLFWSTMFQYSNQRDNLGINSRLQWRFAPLSDLYLVYNDNYLTRDFGPRFRAINLKVTYWLNI